ncbi:MAG: dockerin type I domain-containing protein [Nanoarchaeota archaeon]|nr:dockerin type I domain-containing protein [Nanoarchaeota archaeon]
MKLPLRGAGVIGAGVFLFGFLLLSSVIAETISCARVDVNSDGVIDIVDLVSVAREFGESQAHVGVAKFKILDVNDDGNIDIVDLVSVARFFGEKCGVDAFPYDYNDDGKHDVADLQHFEQVVVGNVKQKSGKLYDLNNDGTVNILDITSYELKFGIMVKEGMCKNVGTWIIRPYDFDNNNSIDTRDFSFLSQFFGMSAQDANAGGRVADGKVVDIDGDGKVDIGDLSAMALCLPTKTDVPDDVCANVSIPSVNRALGRAYYDYNQDDKVNQPDLDRFIAFFGKTYEEVFPQLVSGKVYDSNGDGKIDIADAVALARCKPPLLTDLYKVIVDHDEMGYVTFPAPDSILIREVGFLSNEFGDVGIFSRKPRSGQSVAISVTTKNERKIDGQVSGLVYKVYKDRGANRMLESEGKADVAYTLKPQERRVIDFTTSFKEAGDYSVDIFLYSSDGVVLDKVMYPVTVVGAPVSVSPSTRARDSFLGSLLNVLWVGYGKNSSKLQGNFLNTSRQIAEVTGGSATASQEQAAVLSILLPRKEAVLRTGDEVTIRWGWNKLPLGRRIPRVVLKYNEYPMEVIHSGSMIVADAKEVTILTSEVSWRVPDGIASGLYTVEISVPSVTGDSGGVPIARQDIAIESSRGAPVKQGVSGAPDLILESPESNAVLEMGKPTAIRWRWSNYNGSSLWRVPEVRLFARPYSARTSGRVLTLPGTFLRNTVSYEYIWNVPADLSPGDYRIAVPWEIQPPQLGAEPSATGIAGVDISIDKTLCEGAKYENFETYDYNSDRKITKVDRDFMGRYFEKSVGDAAVPTGKRLDLNGDRLINISDISIMNSCGAPSAPATRGVGAITVCDTDINRDGVVDIVDLVTVAREFGSTNVSDPTVAKADIDWSGTIDIVDLVLIGRNFGERCR